MMILYGWKYHKDTEAHLEASREVGLEVNAEKTKYMVMSHHQNIGQTQNLLIANKSFEFVVKYLGMKVTSKLDSWRN